MTRLMKPGMLFQADRLPYPGQGGLEATMSNYGIPDLEESPRPWTTYVVCRDGSIQDNIDRKRPIGWELLENGNEWFYRVTQMNHKPKPLAVFYMGTTEDVPAGRGKIGSVVFCATMYDPPQMAEMIIQEDAGEEVTSGCPGAPKKAVKIQEDINLEKITKNLGEDFAAAAVMVGDPAQTDALAKFAEGKMSYAEMRAYCG